MNGNKYLLDTNAAVSLINGNPAIVALTDSASWVGISVISIIEFLSFPELISADKLLFLNFLKDIEVVDISFSNPTLIEEVCNMRSQYKLKLPDAIIAASAAVNNCSIVTNDKDFLKISSLSVISH